MINLINLYFLFAKIGLLTIGGGYAMIPLIRQEIFTRNWMSSEEFATILGFSEMTPGPIAVNSASFVGLRMAGIPGGVAATLGVITPSLLIILLISRIFFKYREHRIQQTLFAVIRPVVTGMILASALIMLRPLFGFSAVSAVDLPGLLLFAGALGLFLRGRVPPPAVLGGSAALGVVLQYLNL